MTRRQGEKMNVDVMNSKGKFHCESSTEGVTSQCIDMGLLAKTVTEAPIKENQPAGPVFGPAESLDPK